VGFFAFDVYFPVFVSVIFLTFISIFFVVSMKKRKIGILMPLMWLICSLPFIHIIPYIWIAYNQDDAWEWWRLTINPYMLEPQVIELTGMIGVVMGFGFCLGCSMVKSIEPYNNNLLRQPKNDAVKRLSYSKWLLWIFIGVFLSWISAPQKDIFSAAYTTASSLIDGLNFSSAWTVSYIVLIFGFCDAVLDENASRKKIKLITFFIVISYVVIVLQLLRGDRECIPLVFGLGLIYFYWIPSIHKKSKLGFNRIKILSGILGLLFISLIIGVLRSGAFEIGNFSELMNFFDDAAENRQMEVANLFRGTWTAVLLTPLSVAGDHIYELLPLKFGSDYWDLLASSIPGFLADAIGYTRPIDGNHGPAWEMRYGIGGTHFSILPFMNFRMIGVFIISIIVAFALRFSEVNALKSLTVTSLTFLCTMIMIAPHWMWYGEKNIMNALIIFIVLNYLYKIFLSLNLTKYKI
jgi:hypothetical protein